MKKIIHVDMDCFYAQVEMRDNPNLRNLPIAVGGLPKTRSVLCTSNYLARKFGVKAAMPSDLAIKKCPDLVIIPPNFKKYQAASDIIQSIFHKYSDAVEPLSLDEAFLDVSHVENASMLLQEIKNEIFKETELTCSIGLAPNKFLAKIASDWNKPNGLFIIKPHQVESFVTSLEVKLIPGIGPKSMEIFNFLKIKTCKELKEADPTIIYQYFGKFAEDLINYASGIDNRDVINFYERKSLSVESTFLEDHYWSPFLENQFCNVLDELNRRLEDYLLENPERKIKKIFAKARFKDFTRTSSEAIISQDDVFDLLALKSKFLELNTSNLLKKEMPVRLLGLGVRFYSEEENLGSMQLPLF